jgi:hypothetical protein
MKFTTKSWGPAIDYDTRIALGLPVHAGGKGTSRKGTSRKGTSRKLRGNSRAVNYFQIGLKKLDGRRVGTRVHYRDDAMRETYSATPAEVRALGRMVHDGVKDAYSHWCAQTPARKAR